MKWKISRIVLLLTSLYLITSCSHDPLISETFSKLEIKNIDTKVVIHTVEDREKVNNAVEKINSAKRTDTWDTTGSSFTIILSNEETTLTIPYYKVENGCNGEVAVRGYYVYTNFCFTTE